MLVPVGWILSAIDWLPISLFESVGGSALGYGTLFGIGYIFTRITGKVGMGQGDVEMLAFIGAFTGPIGCFVTLTIASTAGAIFGLVYGALFKRKRTIIVPFGPFLALGAIVYTLFEHHLFSVVF